MLSPGGIVAVLHGLCLACALLANSVAAGQETVSVEWVETRFLRFPAISLDRIHYDALAFEYTTRAPAAIRALRTLSETLVCDGQPLSHDYLAIDYSGPEVLFRVLDRHHHRLLLLQPMDTAGSTTYGQGLCPPVAADTGHTDPAEQFAHQHGAWLDALNTRLLAQAHQSMVDFIREETALDYEALAFPLFSLHRNGSGERLVNEAAAQARTAFQLYARFGVTLDAQAALRRAVHDWALALGDADKAPGLVALDDRGREALHRNLSVAYLFLHNFEQARRHDALALARGMSGESSLQETILRYERRAILSPQVAQDPVQMLSLYRSGRNRADDTRLVWVDRFDEWQETLGTQRVLRR